MTVRPNDPLASIRTACRRLPEIEERPSHGAPTFFVRGKKSFVMVMLDGHHQNQFPHLWFAAPPGVQGELVDAEPDRFFVPPYVGGRGWVGLRLDRPVDDDELTNICREAYRTVAPATLIARLDGDG